MLITGRREIRVGKPEGDFVFAEVRSRVYDGGTERVTLRYDGPNASGASPRRNGQTLEAYITEILGQPQTV